jgi:peptidoglycan/xylan/chitin deacetylase (PgdA/CDA1 family)
MMLAVLAGCSGLTTKQPQVAEHGHLTRNIATVNDMLSDSSKVKAKIDKLMTGISQGYMLGQVYLDQFDRELDKNPEGALKSDTYSSLLAIRTFVDKFEHQINDMYVSMVLVSSSPEYTPDQKNTAEVALKSIGNYLNGVRSDKSNLPDNLKPLILSNLREKQVALFEDLKALQDEVTLPSMKESLQKHMKHLRTTRMTYFKNLMNYHVDRNILQQSINEEKKKKSFKEFEQEVKDLSKDIKKFISEIGRGTSSDEIVPSTGPSGNISGRTFPHNTWSLTYDDGPGKSTTDQILKNLVDRKMPATFFMLAKQVEAYPAAALRLKDAGMDLASHSYTHAQLTKVGTVQLEREIGTSKRVIESKLDTQVKLFRLPYGAGVSAGNVRAKIAEHGMVHVFWNVDTLDWQDKNPQSIMTRTLKQMQASPKNSGIVLFHDIHSQSVIASTLLMDHFNKEKLNVCTVQGVVDQMNQNLPSCK